MAGKMSSSSDDDSDLTPEHIKERATQVVQNLLPAKSQEKYQKAYENYINWKETNGAKSNSETVLLAYFQEKSENLKSSTLWSIYSMLRSTIDIRENIQINNYTKLIAFLKRKSVGSQPKKSKVLTADEITLFLLNAPDDTYLAIKVILIVGVNGACRVNELVNIKMQDIEKHSESLLLVNLPDTKTKKKRSFVIRDEHVKLVERYQALRPPNTKSDRFFINYSKGKCTRQVIGRNKLSSMPREIATYLKLPDPLLYTGHCFRRTSATLLADSGADLTVLKRHGGWKSSGVAEGYIEDSINNKSKISSRISENIQLQPNTSTADPWTPRPSTSKEYTSPSRSPPQFSPPPSKKPKPNPPVELHGPEAINSSQTNISSISVPHKTVTLNINNSTNVSNIHFHF